MAALRRIATIFIGHDSTSACRRFYESIEAMLRGGIEVLCISAQELKLESHEKLTVELVRPPKSKRFGFALWFWFSCKAPLVLIREMRKNTCSAIVVTQAYYSFLAAPASLFLRKPIVLLLESSPWKFRKEESRKRFRDQLRSFIDCLGVCWARHILVGTNALKEEISVQIPLVRDKIKHVPYAVTFPKAVLETEREVVDETKWQAWLNAFLKRRNEVATTYQLPERWLFLSTSGALVGRQGLEALLRAMSATENDRLALLICGDGPEKNYLQTIVVGLGLSEQVIFTGWLPNVLEVIGGCDLYIQPSLNSGMEKTILEALGVGVPVLASDTPTHREVLQGQSELLFDSADVDLLAAKLGAVLNARSGKLEQIKKISRQITHSAEFDRRARIVSFLESI